jgi:quaternary ammonium compound-resistance protein SugE
MIACVFEITWVVAMKYSDGFTRLWPAVITLAASLISFVLLAQAIRVLPVGTCYVVLNSVGTAGAVIFGIALFGDSMSPFRIVCVSVILLGVVGLRLSTT